MKPHALPPFNIFTRQEIVSTLNNLSQVSVAVMGDFCLDIYWIIDRSSSEISIETGLKTEPVRQCGHEFSGPGGSTSLSGRGSGK
jgi:bifunctional ADP-heptose synthase (sugar kinase/adenylyltransferase)